MDLQEVQDMVQLSRIIIKTTGISARSCISVKNNFERRLGIWPAGFDKDDVMWCNTAFGDYPALSARLQDPTRHQIIMDTKHGRGPGILPDGCY